MPTNPLSFPCLDNGMIAQLPVRLELNRVAPANRFPDGSMLYAATDAKLQYNWTLRYNDLNANEWERFEDFFTATGNGAAAFAFYDPLGNLLASSGDLRTDVWVAPAGLAVAPFSDSEVEDAFLLTNPTSTPLTLTQSVGVAGEFQTCFSLLARWSGGTAFSLQQSSGADTVANEFRADRWARHPVVFTGSAGSAARTAAIIVPPITQIIVAAPLLEISAAPTAYSKTGSASGVFPRAWIAQKKIDLQSPTPGGHSVTLQIESLRQS